MNPNRASILQEAAKSQNLSPKLLEAILSVEAGPVGSSFREDVLSGKIKGPKGELGGFQFMPETAKELGITNPLDFEQAAFGAAKYLRQNIDYFDGDEDKGIAAYNTGRGNVESSAAREYLSKIRKIYEKQNVAQYRQSQQIPTGVNLVEYFGLDDIQPTETTSATDIPQGTDLIQYYGLDKETQEIDSQQIPEDTNLVDYYGLEKTSPEDTITKSVDVKEDTTLANTDPNEVSLTDAMNVRAPSVKLNKLEEEELLKDENINIMLNYFAGRYGDNYAKEELKVINKDGSVNKEKLIEEFKDQMRFIEFNQTRGGAVEFAFLANITDRETIRKIVEGHELYQKLPDFFDKIEEGDYLEAAKKFGSAFVDTLTDPLNLVGFGSSIYFKHKIAREGIKTLLRQKIKEFRLDKKIKPSEKLTRQQYKDVKQQTYDALGIDPKSKKFKFLSPTRLKAFGVAGGLETIAGAASSIIGQQVDNEVARQRVKIDTADMIDRGISPRVAKTMEKERLKAIEVDPLLVGTQAILQGILGGYGASAVIRDKTVFRTSTDIYNSQLKGKRLELIEQNPEIEQLQEAFHGFITKEYGNTKLDFGTIDFNKIAGLVDIKKVKGFKDTKSFIDYVKKEGRVTLQQLQDAGVLTEPQIKNDLIKRALTVGYEIIIRNPEIRNEIIGYGPKNAQVRISDAITKILNQLADDRPTAVLGRFASKEFNQDILKGALEKAGITAEDFTYAFRESIGDAGRKLNAVSQIGKGIRYLRNLDPDMQKALDNHFANSQHNDIAYKFTYNIVNLIQRLERESKAFVVSGLVTTVRNVYGSTIGLAFDTAARVLDFVVYNALKITDGAITGQYKTPYNKFLPKVLNDEKGLRLDATNFNLPHLIETEFGVLGQLAVSQFDLNKLRNIKSASDVLDIFAPIKGQVKLSDQLDLFLAADPYTKKLILTSLQESGTESLSRTARLFNSLNIIQDGFMRKNIFTHSIKRQLARQGINFEDLLTKNIKIDPDVIKNAADEAMEGTFAKMPESVPLGTPKRGTGIVEGTEQLGANLAYGFVKFFENMPLGSLAVIFPRFMVNAMAWQYKYNTIGQTLKAGDLAYEVVWKSTQRRKLLLEKLKGVDDLRKAKDEGRITNDEFAKILKRDGLEGFASKEGREALLRQDSIRRDKAMQDLSLAMTRSAVGTSAIYGAYAYRLENQDTKFHEIKLPDGSTYSILAVFPLAPMLAVGDYFAKLKLGRPEETPIRELGEALAGIKISPVPLIQGLEDIATFSVDLARGTTTSSVGEKMREFGGKLIGDFVNRFQQFPQPLFGLVDSIHTEYTVLRDPNQLDNDQNILMETAFNTVLSRTSGALSDGIAATYNKIAPEPFKEWMKENAPYLKTKTELKERVRFFDPNASIRGTEVFDAIRGVRIESRVNDIEQEYKRLNFNPYRLFGSTGDRKFDAAVRKEALQYIAGEYGLIESLITPGASLNIATGYNKSSRVQQKRLLVQYTKLAIQQASEFAAARDFQTIEARNRLAKRWFNRLPTFDRRLLADKYVPVEPGKTLYDDYSNKQRYYNTWINSYEIEIPESELGSFSDSIQFGSDQTREALQ